MTETINSKQIKIAKRYASAISKLDDRLVVLQDLYNVLSTQKTSQDLKEFLENPVIKKQDKKEIIEKVFVNSIALNTKHLLFILVDKNRFGFLSAIVDTLQKEIDELENTTRVEILSAIELTDDEKNAIENKLQNKFTDKIIANYSVDKSLIAGLLIKMGDRVIDLSMKSKFDTMKKQII